jgi:hypothetical protein
LYAAHLQASETCEKITGEPDEENCQINSLLPRFLGVVKAEGDHYVVVKSMSEKLAVEEGEPEPKLVKK